MKIGSPQIQTFYGMATCARAASGFLVITSEFTPAAQASARETDIELISGERIAACYREAEPELRRQAELRLQRDEQWRQE